MVYHTTITNASYIATVQVRWCFQNHH